MKIPGIIACALIAIASSHGEVVMGQKNMVAKKSKPNVILIYTDDQGSLDLNIYGAKELQTPNIDRLARNGVRFTSFQNRRADGQDERFRSGPQEERDPDW